LRHTFNDLARRANVDAVVRRSLTVTAQACSSPALIWTTVPSVSGAWLMPP